MPSEPDWKPRRRIKDPGLMKRLHYRGGSCVLADDTCEPSVSLHHVYPRGQGGDDVEANLVWLCGSGTTGHHGQLTANDPGAREALIAVLPFRTTEYLSGKLGGPEAAREWLRRHL